MKLADQEQHCFFINTIIHILGEIAPLDYWLEIRSVYSDHSLKRSSVYTERSCSLIRSNTVVPVFC